MKADKKLKLENSQLAGFASWLNELNLDGAQSRERTRIVKMMANRIEEIEDFRLEILNKYSEKDENGKNKMNEDGKSVMLVDDKKDKFIEEIKDLYAEEYTFNIDAHQLRVLKDIVLNTGYKFGPKEDDNPVEKQRKIRQANDYVVWCDALEKVAE